LVSTDETDRGLVLIVDDDIDFSRVLSEALQQAGYRTITCASGPEALRIVDEMKDAIDLAVIDLVLPGMSGFEVVGAIKRRPNPIKVAVTSLVMRELYMEIAKTFGAHAVFRKSRDFDPAEWLRAIDSVLEDVKARRADQGS
jgi:CheY-like chemotaxis protein